MTKALSWSLINQRQGIQWPTRCTTASNNILVPVHCGSIENIEPRRQLFRSFEEHPVNWKRLARLLPPTFFTSDFSRLIYMHSHFGFFLVPKYQFARKRCARWHAGFQLSVTERMENFRSTKEPAIGYWFSIKSVFLSSASLRHRYKPGTVGAHRFWPSRIPNTNLSFCFLRHF